MASAIAGVSRRYRAQRDAVRVPNPFLETAQRCATRPWGSLRAGLSRARLYGGGACELCGARHRAARAARRRPGGRLGLSASIAGFRRGARLSPLRNGVEPLRGRGLWWRPRRRRRAVRRALRARGHILHRCARDNRRDSLHSPVHGRCARLCADRSRGSGDRHLSRTRPRSRRPLSRRVAHLPVAALASEAGTLDGVRQTAARLSRSMARWRGCSGC